MRSDGRDTEAVPRGLGLPTQPIESL